MSQTYLVVEVGPEPRYILCARCGHKSYNPNDINDKFCGRCHIYHEDPLPNPGEGKALNEVERVFVALAIQSLTVNVGPTAFSMAEALAGKLGIMGELVYLLNDYLEFSRKEEHELRNG